MVGGRAGMASGMVVGTREGAAASSAPDHGVSMGTRTDGRSHEVDAQ